MKYLIVFLLSIGTAQASNVYTLQWCPVSSPNSVLYVICIDTIKPTDPGTCSGRLYTVSGSPANIDLNYYAPGATHVWFRVLAMTYTWGKGFITSEYSLPVDWNNGLTPPMIPLACP